MDNNGVSIRFDDGTNEFVTSLSVKGVGDFEGSGPELSDALVSLAEQLASAGV
jgi:hypothetical protein